MKIINVIGPDDKEIQIQENQLAEYQKKGYEQSYSLIDPQGNPTIVPLSSLKWAKDQGFKLNPDFADEADVGKLESGARGFLKEMSMGLADEIGGIGGVLTGKGYSKGKEEWQAKDTLADLANPKSYTAGQAVGIGGSMALPLGVAGKGLSKVMQAGALQGAVQGFGEGEGLEESLEKAAIGAGVGAGVGAGFHGLSKAASGLVNPIQELGQAAKGKAVGLATQAAKLGGLSDESTAVYQKLLSDPKLLREAEEQASKFSKKLPDLTIKAQAFSDEIADTAGNYFERNFKDSLKTMSVEELQAVKQHINLSLSAIKAAPKDYSKPVKDMLASTFSKAPTARDGGYAWELRRNIDDLLFREGQKNANLNRYDTDLLVYLRDNVQKVMHQNPNRAAADKLYSDFSDAWTNGLKKELVDKNGKVTGAKVEHLLNPKRQSEGRGLDMEEKWDAVENYLTQNLDALPPNLQTKFQEFRSERNPLQLLKEYNRLKAESGSSTGRTLGTLVSGQAFGPLGAAVGAAVYNPVQILQAQQLIGKAGKAVSKAGNVIDKLMARGFSKQQSEQLATRLGASILSEE
jgi:hypothetical protein